MMEMVRRRQEGLFSPLQGLYMCCCLGGSTCKVSRVVPEAACIQCRLPACLDAHCARLLPLYKHRHQGVSSLVSKDMAADV